MSLSVASASFEHLPPEILSIIFKLVFYQSRQSGLPVQHEASSLALPIDAMSTWDQEDIHSSTLFPFALAAVNTTWRDVMSAMPEFWTRVVMFTNTTSPNSSDLRASHAGLEIQIKWSNNLFLDVFITRLQDGVIDTIEDEGQFVRKAINSLEPHVGRCKSMNYSVLYSSSLPLITADLNHHAPILTQLELNSCNYSKTVPPHPLTRHASRLHFPLLQCLAVDGRNFIDLCTQAPDWLERRDAEDPGDPAAITLRISHHRERAGEELEGNSLWDLLVDVLPKVHHLSLDSIEIGDPRERENDIDYPLESLDLEKVNSRFISELIYCIGYIDNMSITDCSVTEDLNYELDAAYLTLNTIPNPQYLASFLSHFNGSSLDIYNSGLDDRALDALAQKPVTGETVNLTGLYISGCPDFTVAALKQFVEGQMAKLAKLQEYEAFEILQVTGKVPKLSAEEKEWFEHNIPTFTWENDENE